MCLGDSPGVVMTGRTRRNPADSALPWPRVRRAFTSGAGRCPARRFPRCDLLSPALGICLARCSARGWADGSSACRMWPLPQPDPGADRRSRGRQLGDPDTKSPVSLHGLLTPTGSTACQGAYSVHSGQRQGGAKTPLPEATAEPPGRPDRTTGKDYRSVVAHRAQLAVRSAGGQ